MSNLEDRYLDLRGLSDYSALPVPTLRDYLRDGLPHFKPKGKILVRKSEFDAWIEIFRVGRKTDLDAIANDAISDLKRAKSNK